MTEERYNGWKNQETWALMLYVNNDEGLQNEALEVAVSAFDEELSTIFDEVSDIPTDRSNAISLAAIRFQEWAESMFTNEGYKDTFGERMPESLQVIAEEIGSLWRVDWYECAESLLEDRLTEFDAEHAPSAESLAIADHLLSHMDKKVNS